MTSLMAKVSGLLSTDAAGDSDVTLATTGSEPFEWQRHFIEVVNTGTAWTGDHDLNVPAEAGPYVVYNNNGTLYNVNVQVTGGAGIGIDVLPREVAYLYCDGTDVYVVSKSYNFENNTITKTQADSPVTLTAADSGQHYDNTGASGTVAFTLPAATKGQAFKFTRVATQTITVDQNGTEVYRYKAADGVTAGVAGKYLSMDADSSIVGVECVVDGVWEYTELSGTFTDEA